ncbi:MAG: DUF4838 domain-containing protein [bacterium]|nr:DUF4838 domain-containing protein [bacterium]
MNRLLLCFHAVVAMVAFGSAAVQPAENLWPDPGFEQTGTAGDAHSGERAGHILVKAEQHWRALGSTFPVEPYATYRATAWAKATIESGAATALYAYQWDSYIWAFTSSARIPDGEDWTQVTTTFRSPTDSIFFHPLAIWDAANTEAWVDDLVIERVMSPEETIAALEKQDAVQGHDARLLARWYVEHGDVDKARAMLTTVTDHNVRADIACVIGLATDDPALRTEMAIAMLGNGAAGKGKGPQRLWEVVGGIESADPLVMLAEAVPNHLDNPTVLDGFSAFAKFCRDRRDNGIIAPFHERFAAFGAFRDSVQTIAVNLGDQASGNAALASLKEAARTWETAVRAERARLGACRVAIGGRDLALDTHVIVTAVEPTPQETTASRDLQMHLERITGHMIPIVPDADCAGKACISIGRNAFTDSLALHINYDVLGAEGIHIATKGRNLVLTGNKRGVLYATYVFLEDYLGCRWFTSDCATWPTDGVIAVDNLDVRYVPPFEYRDTDYPKCRAPEFGVRNRLNGKYAQATEAWGGKVDYKGFVHTFHNLVPTDQYFATHPEYFSEIGGNRVHERTQLCLTNPDALRIATASVLRWIEESPSASIVSVSQNDCRGYCTCTACAALAEKEGSESGPLVHFVNAIADVVAEKHPDVIIDTLAYQYTRKPPKHVRPRPNVAIRLCSIECEFNRPLATSSVNSSFVEDIKGWNAICDRLHIWDYVINYAHCVQPFPNFDVLKPNIQFFRDHGVTGIYEEANYFSRGGELAELRTYVMAKLLWDPEYDVDTAVDEFCKAYYGKAWHFVRAYFDDIHRLAVADPGFHMHIWAGQDGPFQTDEALAVYRNLFDRAEALVQDDPVRLHRVQVARLPIMYTQLAKGAGAYCSLEDDALVPTVSGINMEGLSARFGAIAKKEGMRSVSEGSGPIDLVDSWLETVNRPLERLPVVRLKSPAGLEAVVVPGLGGRILSLKADGDEMMMVVADERGVEPRTGGYKEFSEFGYRSPGWIEPYAVVEQGERFVVLEAALNNGLKLNRRYELDTERPVLRVATVLTNTTEASKSTCLRVHPCFRLLNAAGATLRLGTGPDAQTLPLDEGVERERELIVPANEMPGAEWAFTDAGTGRTVVSRFMADQMDTCYFNWNGPNQRANLELWSKKQELAPGGSLRLDHEYEIQ